jgi:hypothetical protein
MIPILIIILDCFQLIPTEFTNRNNLYQYFNPPDSIVWWEIGQYDPHANSHRTVFCSDTCNRMNLTYFDPEKTYASPFFNPLPFSDYLIYMTQSGHINHVKDVDELPAFIGSVDNLAEALFLASIYGYDSEPNMYYGSYCFKNGVYTFKLFKITIPAGHLHTTYLDKKGNVIKHVPLKAIIQVNMNGDVYEINGTKNESLRKLQSKDMHTVTWIDLDPRK